MREKTKRKNKFIKGFSIVELSIVLTVIALIATSALAVGASRVESSRIRHTEKRMDDIIEAMEFYVKHNGYLPCPSNPAALITGQDFGDGEGTNNTNGNCTASTITRHGATDVVTGGLPTKQLNIAPADSTDSWNRRFTYVVDEDLTWTDLATPDGWANPDLKGEIIIESTPGIQVTDEAVVVLISHGTNGHGAWKSKGSTQINKGCGVSDHEDSNTTLTGGLCTVPDNIFIKHFRTNNYDDMIEYRIKWQFTTP